MLQAILGAVAGGGGSERNVAVASEKGYDRAAPAVEGEGECHVIICALDYKRTSNPLTCSMDGQNMEKLIRQCGIEDVTAMYDEQCTKDNVLRVIAEVGDRCGTDDYFIFYYSGHGTSVEDEDGDEEDGKDEAFCFVDAVGQVSQGTLLTDDEFAEAVVEAIDEDVRILILTDCCHSGTIADLGKEKWGHRQVISIAGCLDEQTSGDMGRGGIFTHSMLLAVDQLEDAGEEDYSVGMLYNATLENDNKVFNSAQDITIQCSSSVTPDRMAWPLIPRGDYKAPLTQACMQAGGGAAAPSPQNAAQMLQMNPQMLAQFGISPQVVNFIDASGLGAGKIDPQKLVVEGVKFYMAGGCKDCKKLADGCNIQ